MKGNIMGNGLHKLSVTQLQELLHGVVNDNIIRDIIEGKGHHPTLEDLDTFARFLTGTTKKPIPQDVRRHLVKCAACRKLVLIYLEKYLQITPRPKKG